MALILIGLTVSAIAGKQGNTGSQSTGSIGISLKIPSTVRARAVKVAMDLSSALPSRDVLCLELNDTKNVSLYVMTYRPDGSQSAPVRHWTTPSPLRDKNSNRPENCDVSVPLELPAHYLPDSGLITLIVSPE